MRSGQEWLFGTIPYLVQNILLYTKRNWCRMSLCILYRMWRKRSSLRQWVASELYRLHHKRNSNWMEGWIPILRLLSRGAMREIDRLVPPPWCQLGKENGRYNCQRFNEEACPKRKSFHFFILPAVKKSEVKRKMTSWRLNSEISKRPEPSRLHN